MGFQPDPEGMRRLTDQISQRITEVDRQLRQAHTGQPAEGILHPARVALSTIGVTLPDAGLREYCQSISDDKGFEFHLT